jgi:spermidine/putrescine transport system permease protein
MSTTDSARRSSRQTLTAWSLLAPGSLVVLTLAVIPLVLVARNSVAEGDVYGGVRGGFTLEHYTALTDPVYAKTLGYSLAMAALNTVFCLVVGYIVSYYIVLQPAARQPLLLLLIIVPFWTDFLVRTFAWITLLGSGGPISALFSLVGIDTGGSFVPSQTAVMLALLYAFLPTAVFPIYASMRGIDPALREAAADLGCGWWRTHARVVAPLSAPGIVAAALLTFVPTLGVFVIPVLLGGGKQLLVGNLIVTMYTEFRNQPMGAALSMIVLVLMLVSIAVAAILLKIRNRGARWTG